MQIETERACLIILLLLAAGWPADATMAPPANDDFAQRIEIIHAPIVLHADTSLATTQAGEPEPTWASGRSVWWTWTAPESGTVSLADAGSNLIGSPTGYVRNAYLPLIQVLLGTELTNLSLQASNYDHFVLYDPRTMEPIESCDIRGNLAFRASRGMAYHLWVDGCLGVFEEVALSFTFTPDPPPPPPPANDDFTNSAPIEGVLVSISASNVSATKEPNEPDHGGEPGGASVWWKWEAPSNGTVVLTPYAPSGPVFAVYTGATLDALHEEGSGTANVHFKVTAGTLYHIAADSPASTTGGVGFDMRLFPFPPNDDFANATGIFGSTNFVAGSNVGATREPGEPEHAPFANNASVWWRWTPPAPGRAHLHVDENTLDPVISVYTGGALTNLSVVKHGINELEFDAVVGETYQIAVAGQVSSEGEIHLEHYLLVNAPTDKFSNRPRLSGYFTGLLGSTWTTSSDPVEPPNSSVWLGWTAPSNELVTVTAYIIGSLSVYSGSTLGGLLPADGNGLLTSRSLITFDAVAGEEYQVSLGQSQGFFGLQVVPTRSLIFCDINRSGRQDDGSFRLWIGGIRYQWFSIEVSGDLIEWNELTHSSIEDPTLGFVYVDTDAFHFPHRFYRILPQQ